MITNNHQINEPIKITINGAPMTVEKGTKLKDLLKQIEPVDLSEEKFLVVSSKKEKKFVEGYTLKTSLGRMMVDLNEDFELKKINLAWTSADVVVFGPISSEANASKSLISKEVKRNTNDIFLLHGESESYLGFSLTNHMDTSLVQEGDENDTVGKVLAGATLLKKFGKNDFITDLEVRYETKSAIEKVDLNSTLVDGMDLYSHVLIELEKSSPISTETFLTYVNNNGGVLEIEDATNAYVRSENPIPFEIPVENNRTPRRVGYVFVRNSGTRAKSIYFYRSNFMRQVRLNCIGKITNGLDLIKVTKPGERLLIRTNPTRVFVVGMSQLKAGDLLSEYGITQERSGDMADNSIVVSQSPSITMEIGDKITTFGIPPEDLIHIRFYEDEAPLSTNYLKNVSGFYRNYPIGKLNIVATSESIVMLDTYGKKEAIVHENVPETGDVGLLGITNMSRPWYGMIGVRLTPDDQYGPTGELLQSTNIIGKIQKGFDKLNSLKSELYFTEV